MGLARGACRDGDGDLQRVSGPVRDDHKAIASEAS